MKKLVVFIPSLVVAIAIMGCRSSEERNIDKLKMVVEKAEMWGDTYSEYDWEKTVYRYGRLMEMLNSNKKLTPDQLKEVGLLIERMNNVTTKHGICTFKNIENDVEELYEENVDSYEEEHEDTIIDNTLYLYNNSSENHLY